MGLGLILALAQLLCFHNSKPHGEKESLCRNFLRLRGIVFLPFLFQDGPLQGVLVNGIALSIVDKGHKFHEQPFLTHTQLPAKILTGQVIILGVGVGLVVREQATTGGTDIVAMILNKYFHLQFSRGVLLADSCVVLAGLVVIGFGIGMDGNATGGWLLSLYSLICIFVSSRVIDYVIDGASYDKLLFIISNENEKLRQFIIHDMERGATILKASGMYTKEDKEMIFLVVSRREVAQVQRKIKSIDPKAFLVVTDAYDTYGEGFKAFPEDDSILND